MNIALDSVAIRRWRGSLALCTALALTQSACPGALDEPSRFLGDGGASAPGTQPPPTVAEAGAPEGTGGPGGTGASPSCPDVPALLASSCGASGCHGGSSPASNLDLASPGLAARVVGVKASGGSGLLVDTSSPSQSVLYTKLGASPPFGARMPPGGTPFDAASAACVLSWIDGLAGGTGGTGGTSEAGASWTPAQSMATVVWLDAAQGVTASGGAVSKWKDLSPFHNDASQGTSGNQPTLAGGAIHNLPAIKFDESKGTFLQINDASSIQFGTGGYLVAIVGVNQKATTGRGHGGGVSTVFAKPQLQGAVELTVHWNFFTAETTDDDSFFHAGQGEGEPGSTSSTKGYNDGNARLYVSRVDTSTGKQTMQLRVNGKQVGVQSGDAPIDVSLPTSPIRIGSTYGQSVQGAIAEIVTMKGNVSDGDLAKLESYLTTKYGLGGM